MDFDWIIIPQNVQLLYHYSVRPKPKLRPNLRPISAESVRPKLRWRLPNHRIGEKRHFGRFSLYNLPIFAQVPICKYFWQIELLIIRILNDIWLMIPHLLSWEKIYLTKNQGKIHKFWRNLEQRFGRSFGRSFGESGRSFGFGRISIYPDSVVH